MVFMIFMLTMLLLFLGRLLAGVVWERWRRYFVRRPMPFTSLFGNLYLDSKAFYMFRFRDVPCVLFLEEMDVSAAWQFIRSAYAEDLVAIYQHNHYDYGSNEARFNVSLLVLRHGVVIELANRYVEILHGPLQYRFAIELARQLSAYREESLQLPEASAHHIRVAGFRRQAEMN